MYKMGEGEKNLFLNQSSGVVTVTVTVSDTPVCLCEHGGVLGHERHNVIIRHVNNPPHTIFP
jgi:hypothetical protein